MLFVDDDDAQVPDGREDGRARADDDARLAALETPPLVEALARGERRVEDGDRIAEVCAQAAREDGRERDLGDEHHRRAPAPQRLAHGADVDFGFAAARDAVQEEGREGVFVLRLVDGAERALLLVGEAQVVRVGQARAGQRVAPDLAHEDLDEPPPLQRLNRRSARRGRVEQLGEEHLAASGEEGFDNLLLCRRQGARAGGVVVGGGEEADGLSPLGARLRAALPVRDGDPARARQLARGLGGARLPQLARRLAQRRRAVRRHGQLQQAPLRGRGLTLGQARQLVAPLGRDGDDLIDARVETRGQRRLQDLAPRRGVVVADPARNLQHLGRQQRLGVEQFFGLFNLSLFEAERGVQLFVERDDVAGRQRPPEGDEQARADACVNAQREGQAVSERLREPERERHLRVERAAVGSGVPACGVVCRCELGASHGELR